MSMIQVTAAKLRSEAENLQSLNQELYHQINELELREYSMQNMWEGVAREAFHAAFMQDKEQMMVFRNLVIRYIQVLFQAAQKYEQVEAQNAEIAARRSR